MNTFKHEFEEMPDFYEGEFRSGSHNGIAEISFESDGEWFIRSIFLDCHNGKIGPAAAVKRIGVSPSFDGSFWFRLEASIRKFCGDAIQERVDAIVDEWHEPSRMTLRRAV